MKRQFIFLLLLPMSLVCASKEPETYEEYQLEKEARKKEALLNIDVEKCVADGGEIIEVGLLELPTCIYTYKDAGKICFDSSECEGRCESKEKHKEAFTEGSGVCQEKSFGGGCFAEVFDGKVAPVMCVD